MAHLNFKKLLICLLILALLPGWASAEGWFNALFGGFASDAARLEYVSVSERAFSTENARVLGAAGDGSKVLITNACELYLWDLQARKRIPLRFTDPQDIEQLNFVIENAYINFLNVKKDKEQLEALREKIDRIEQEYFKKKGIECFTSFDELNECFPKTIQLGANVSAINLRYAIVEAYRLPGTLLVDLVTGETRFLETNRYLLYGDSLFDLEEMSITRLDSGETVFPAYTLPDSEASLGMVKARCVLNGDSVAALIPEAAVNENYERTMFLHLASAQNGFQAALGMFRYDCEPDTLLPLGNGRYVAAYSRNGYRKVPIFIIDCLSGEMQQLEPGKLMPVSATEDTFLFFDMETLDSRLTALDPETMEQSQVAVSGVKNMGYAAISSVVANGEGLYFVQNDILHGYFELVNQ